MLSTTISAMINMEINNTEHTMANKFMFSAEETVTKKILFLITYRCDNIFDDIYLQKLSINADLA